MNLLTLNWPVCVTLAIFFVFGTLYFYMTRNFNYWKKRGVLQVQPIPFFGNLRDCCLLRISIPQYFQSLYELGRGLPYVGFYVFDKPTLVLRDPEIIKNILIKDFNNFPNRYATAIESDAVGTSNLFFQDNPTWKTLRKELTPIFSVGKIRAMFPLILTVGDDLVDYLESLNPDGDGEVIELKEICAKYTTDVLGSYVFGLRVNSLNNPDAEFRKYGKKIFEANYKRGFEMASIFFLPSIARFLQCKVFTISTTEFLRKVFWDTFNKRLESGLRRNDLIDLLMDLRSSRMNNVDPDGYEFDGDNLVAQAAALFVAGFETSATLMSFTLHALSLNLDVQTKLRHEIHAALDKNNGKLSYDVVQELSYLDKVTSETLRKYPSITYLEREALRDYTIPKTGLVVEKGTPIYVSLLGLHYDSEYFPDPENYDPERFNEGYNPKLYSLAYLPFGDGPRKCVGLRLGLLQAKVGIIHVVSKYEIVPCEKTLFPMQFDPKAFVLASEGGLYHRLRRMEMAGS